MIRMPFIKSMLHNQIHLALQGYESNYNIGDRVPPLENRKSYYMPIDNETSAIVINQIVIDKIPNDEAHVGFAQAIMQIRRMYQETVGE